MNRNRWIAGRGRASSILPGGGVEGGYTSDIVMGEAYVDEQTGFRGVAVGVYFYQYGCERVNLEAYDGNRKDIRSLVFDAPRLRSVKTGAGVKVTRTGGPGTGNEHHVDPGAIR